MTYEPHTTDAAGISVVKTKDGEYRVSCLRQPFASTRSFREAAAHYFHRAHKNPAAGKNRAIYTGLDESEMLFLESLRQLLFSDHREDLGST
ncbi:MAG: hypothetical protein MUF61_00470 [archaeon]|jgi:hypothetical protein|nr:hypothetical protein [archaeon]